jgi:hypothetical protein
VFNRAETAVAAPDDNDLFHVSLPVEFLCDYGQIEIRVCCNVRHTYVIVGNRFLLVQKELS